MPGSPGTDARPPIWIGGLSLAYLAFLGTLFLVGRPVLGFLPLPLLAVALLFWARTPRWGGVVLLLIQLGIGFQHSPAIVFEARGFLLLVFLLLVSSPLLIVPHLPRKDLIGWREALPYALFLGGGVLTHLQYVWSPFALVYPVREAEVFLVGVVLGSLCVLLLLRAGVLEARRLLSLMVSGGLLMAVAVVAHAFAFEHDFTLSRERLGVYLPIGPNHLGFALDMVLPVCIGLALDETERCWRNYYVLAALLMGVAIVFTGTRGSLGTQVLIAAWVIYRFRRNRLFWVGMAAFAFVAVLFVAPKAASRLVSTSQGDMMSNLGRVWMLQAALGILDAKGYVLGVGFDAFRLIKYQFGFPFWFNPQRTMSSHNTYLEYWVGWGFPSLAGYLLLVGMALRRIWNGTRAHSSIHTGVLIGVLGYSFHGLVDCSLVLFPITLAFWILCAVALAEKPPQRSPA